MGGKEDGMWVGLVVAFPDRVWISQEDGDFLES